jgi:hypothetical protein
MHRHSSRLADSERPLADAANAFMGPIGAAIIVVGALISILGNLNVGLLGASRITYAMGAGEEMPRVFAATHERFRTPWVSIAINGVIIFVLSVQASFLTAVAIATITRLLGLRNDMRVSACFSTPERYAAGSFSCPVRDCRSDPVAWTYRLASDQRRF